MAGVILHSLSDLGLTLTPLEQGSLFRDSSVVKHSKAALQRQELARKSVPTEEWPKVPEGHIACEAHTYMGGFFEGDWQSGGIVRPGEVAIAVPESEVAPDDMTWGSIPFLKLEYHGWMIVDGLRYDNIGMTGGHSATIPFNGFNLVPPPGIWKADLPQQIAHGDYVPDPKLGWACIYDINAGFLAWEVSNSRSREGWQVEGAKWYRYMDIGDERWWFHLSIRGIFELVIKKYGTVPKYREDTDTLILPVSEWDAPLWVGPGGRIVKNLAEWIGVRDIQIVNK